MKKFIILFPTVVFSLVINAQLASYNFNSDTTDQVGGYDATSFGSPTYVNGEYVSLDSTDYFELPNTLQAAIDTSKSFEIRARFKIEGNYNSTTGDDVRIIFSSKTRYDQRWGGFEMAAREWDGTLQLIATYGDGVMYPPFGCPTCGPFSDYSEGKIDFITGIETGIWYDLTVKFIFDKATPYIQYIVNNAVFNSFYNDKLDYEAFKSTVINQQICVGANKNNEVMEQTQFPKLHLDIDYLTVASPILPGDTNVLGSVLDQLTDEINGSITLTSAEIDSLASLFVINWDDQSFSANRDKILAYISAYADNYPAIFNNAEMRNPKDFSPVESIQYVMEQWILDNQYGPSTVKDMAGIVFKEHEVFPGSVSALAPRLAGATFTIDGDYQTDPGFVLNGQDYAKRPTGYYVPPGELVTITAPMSAVNKGLTLYVGAHNKNVEETWSEFSRFPRISTSYQIDTNIITIANPFGGGIYITIPDSSNLGALEFTIDGAVKAPYYCTKVGFSSTLAEFKSDIANNYVPWLDMESSNFMCTISAGEASLMTEPDSILSIWDKTFDAYNIALGRPLERFRGEYLIVDCQSQVKYTFAAASYPMALITDVDPYDPDLVLPVAVEQGSDWYKDQEAIHFIVCHEFGHLHNMPTLILEQEANVNLPAVAVYNLVMGETIDSAFEYSLRQWLNFDETALDWILTPIFYKGYRMGLDTINYVTYNDAIQTSYQQRGYAKLVDIANLFGWDALGNIMGYFYEYKRENPKWDPYSLGDDEFIEVASLRMGFNMAPHFEFWGIIPSDSLVQKLDTMPVSEVIKERILHFRTLVPTNNTAIQPLCDTMISKLEPQHDVRYEAMKTNYDETTAQKIIDRIDSILFKYYDFDSTFYNQSPTITGLMEPIVIEQNSSKTLAITDLIIEDPDNVFPDDFSIMIKAGANYSVSGDTIAPDPCFAGLLQVPIIVSDGIEESMEYTVEIEVKKALGVDIQTACEAFTWIDGNTYTSSIDTITFIIARGAANGCDSLVILDLTILEPSSGADVISACESYTWIDGITYTESNSTAKYTLTNSVGCDSIVTLDLTIADTCTNTSVSEISNNDVRVYPNPVHDHLMVELPSNNYKSIEILELSGKTIRYVDVLNQNRVVLDMKLKSGMYLMRIISKDKTQLTRLLVKE